MVKNSIKSKKQKKLQYIVNKESTNYKDEISKLFLRLWGYLPVQIANSSNNSLDCPIKFKLLNFQQIDWFEPYLKMVSLVLTLWHNTYCEHSKPWFAEVYNNILELH